MKVVATKMGFYGNRRIREGQRFTIKGKEEFSKNWMVLADDKGKAHKPAKEKPANAVDLNESVI